MRQRQAQSVSNFTWGGLLLLFARLKDVRSCILLPVDGIVIDTLRATSQQSLLLATTAKFDTPEEIKEATIDIATGSVVTGWPSDSSLTVYPSGLGDLLDYSQYRMEIDTSSLVATVTDTASASGATTVFELPDHEKPGIEGDLGPFVVNWFVSPALQLVFAFYNNVTASFDDPQAIAVIAPAPGQTGETKYLPFEKFLEPIGYDVDEGRLMVYEDARIVMLPTDFCSPASIYYTSSFVDERDVGLNFGELGGVALSPDGQFVYKATHNLVFPEDTFDGATVESYSVTKINVATDQRETFPIDHDDVLALFDAEVVDIAPPTASPTAAATLYGGTASPTLAATPESTDASTAAPASQPSNDSALPGPGNLPSAASAMSKATSIAKFVGICCGIPWFLHWLLH